MRDIHSLSIFAIFTVVNIVGAQQHIVDSNARVLNNCFENENIPETSDAANAWQCLISAVDTLTNDRFHTLLKEKRLHLLEYQLEFMNYSSNDNPLTVNVKRHHRANVWVSVSSHHGQTLLSLAFNYAVLSLTTLSFHTASTVVRMEDHPIGCFGGLQESRKIELVQRLFLTDFKLTDGSNASLEVDAGEEEEKICHKVVRNNSGYAQFADCCCFTNSTTGVKVCNTRDYNVWLTLLNIALYVFRSAVILFGPLMFLPSADKLVDRQVNYKVTLKEPLKKKIALVCLSPEDRIPENIEYKRRINFSRKEFTDLPNLGKSLEELTRHGVQSLTDQCFETEIHDYHITVDYDRLFGENEVPVSFTKSFTNNLFKCEIGETEAFAGCCGSRLCPCVCRMKWINFWRFVGVSLLAIVIPTPYYIRLVIFYFFEYDEVMLREAAAKNLGLKNAFEGSLMHYLGPHHPAFLAVYAVCFVLFISLIYGRSNRKTKKKTMFYEMVVTLISDLRGICLTDVLTMTISNVIWPFEKCGLLGVFFALVYWPVVLPVTFLISIIYCLPTAYLTFRLCLYPVHAFLQRVFGQISEKSEQIFQIKHIWKHFFKKKTIASVETGDRSSHVARRNLRSTVLSGDFSKFMDKIASTDKYRENASSSNDGDDDGQLKRDSTSEPKLKCTQVVKSFLVSVFGIACLFSVLIIVYETVTCLTEVAIFTIMGVIVNADSVLKYVSLIALVVIYIYDSFNNVGQKYFKLSRALFTIAKGRVKKEELEKITTLPAELQDNYGFKTQEMSEQGEHEDADDVDSKISRNWFINDLVLFVDRDDVPRVPKKLFNELCTIQVKGVPGPVYLGFCFAVKEFLKIIVLVLVIFLAILAFGEVSGLSATNQTLAALVGGMFPLLLKTVMKAPNSDIEMETVSYTNKLNEIINNYNQRWPMFDFSFKLSKEAAAAAAAAVCSVEGETRQATDRIEEEFGPILVKRSRISLLPKPKSSPRRSAAGGLRRITSIMRKTCLLKTEVDILIILPEGYEEHLSKQIETSAAAAATAAAVEGETSNSGIDHIESEVSNDQPKSSSTRPKVRFPVDEELLEIREDLL